jgi:hypothetical protein
VVHRCGMAHRPAPRAFWSRRRRVDMLSLSAFGTFGTDRTLAVVFGLRSVWPNTSTPGFPRLSAWQFG